MKKGSLNMILTALVFVTLEPVSKLIANDVSPYATTFWRFLIGSFWLLPFAVSKIREKGLHISTRDIGVLLLFGILFICISMLSLQLAVKIAVSPALVAILFSSNSIFSILFAALISKERITLKKLCTIILCTIGVLICVDFKSNTNIESVILAIFSAASFSLYSVLSHKHSTKLDSSVQTCLVFLLGSLALFVILLFAQIPIVPVLTFKSASILVYLGIIVTGIGYHNYFKAIEKGGTIMGSLAFFVKPILTPFATFVINGIVPGVNVFIAMLFIICGSYITVAERNKVKSNL